MKRIIMDLDDTICSTLNGDYGNSLPKHDVIDRMKDFKAMGFEIVICTSRNMRTYSGNIGKINANTLPVIIDWLNRHEVPYDEIYTGKPWCGTEGFYVDDRAVRPNEFASMSIVDIKNMLGIKE